MPLKCTKCKLPKRGHDGPIDNECVLDEIGEGAGAGKYQTPSDQDETEEDDPIDPQIPPANIDNNGARVKKTPSPRKPKHKVDNTALAFKEIPH
jgi:hypothetical protein